MVISTAREKTPLEIPLLASRVSKHASFGVYHYMGFERSLGMWMRYPMKENKQLSTW
jgi:hypothetical protein